jgi:ABC-type multidrug transport system fused ATPase/permease subunit
VRWRSHRHVLRQSVGWFQNDFAGRIANRMMQTAPAVGEAAFQTFDALIYAGIYLIGALWLLSDTDPRLAIPLWSGSASTSGWSPGRSRAWARRRRTSLTRAPPSPGGS